MSAHPRLRDDPGWANGTDLENTDLKSFDDTSIDCLDGDGGGAYVIGGATTIDGAGVKLMTTCPVTGASAAVRTPNGSGFRIVHGDDDYTLLKSGHPGRSRTLVSNTEEIVNLSGGEGRWNGESVIGCATSTGMPGAVGMIPLRVHHGAELVSVTFRLATVFHANVPANLPQFGVYAIDHDGVRTPLSTVSTATGGLLPFSPTPGSGAAWFAVGAEQSFVYTVDAGTFIDVGKYAYWAEIHDESGANAVIGTVYYDISCAFDTILDLRPG